MRRSPPGTEKPKASSGLPLWACRQGPAPGWSLLGLQQREGPPSDPRTPPGCQRLHHQLFLIATRRRKAPGPAQLRSVLVFPSDLRRDIKISRKIPAPCYRPTSKPDLRQGAAPAPPRHQPPPGGCSGQRSPVGQPVLPVLLLQDLDTAQKGEFKWEYLLLKLLLLPQT